MLLLQEIENPLKHITIMRKFLLFIALVLMGAMGGSVSAKWELGHQLASADLKDGDTILLKASNSMNFKALLEALKTL